MQKERENKKESGKLVFCIAPLTASSYCLLHFCYYVKLLLFLLHLSTCNTTRKEI